MAISDQALCTTDQAFDARDPMEIKKVLIDYYESIARKIKQLKNRIEFQSEFVGGLERQLKDTEYPEVAKPNTLDLIYRIRDEIRSALDEVNSLETNFRRTQELLDLVGILQTTARFIIEQMQTDANFVLRAFLYPEYNTNDLIQYLRTNIFNDSEEEFEAFMTFRHRVAQAMRKELKFNGEDYEQIFTYLISVFKKDNQEICGIFFERHLRILLDAASFIDKWNSELVKESTDRIPQYLYPIDRLEEVSSENTFMLEIFYRAFAFLLVSQLDIVIYTEDYLLVIRALKKVMDEYVENYLDKK